jgi:hypothetical protein
MTAHFFMIARFFYDNILFDGDKISDDRTIDNTLFGDRQIFECSKICLKQVFFYDGKIFFVIARFFLGLHFLMVTNFYDKTVFLQHTFWL